jgi:hypothetical protein
MVMEKPSVFAVRKHACSHLVLHLVSGVDMTATAPRISVVAPLIVGSSRAKAVRRWSVKVVPSVLKAPTLNQPGVSRILATL